MLALQQNINRLSDATLTRQVGLAGFTVLIWDHAITFDEEVCLIWKGIRSTTLRDYRKIIFFALFFLNRYVVPLSFAVNIFAYFSSTWTYNTCSNFVVYEGAMTMIGIAVADLIMLSRIDVIWRRSRYHPFAVGALFSIWLAFVTVNTWLLTHAQPEFTDTGPFKSCTMIFDAHYGRIAPASAWLPLLFDTAVIALTLVRTRPTRDAGPSALMRELLREGVLYYGVVLAVTLALTLMIAFANPGVQNICAQLELCLTAAMMSRITLALKRQRRRFCVPDAPHTRSRRASALECRADAPAAPERALSRVYGYGHLRFDEHARGDSMRAAGYGRDVSGVHGDGGGGDDEALEMEELAVAEGKFACEEEDARESPV